MPYPIFLLTSAITAMIMVNVGVDYRGSTNLIVRAALNIGGPIIFYALFRKSQKAHKMNCPAPNPMKSDIKELLIGLAVAVFLVCIIFVVTAEQKNTVSLPKLAEPLPSNTEDAKIPAAIKSVIVEEKQKVLDAEREQLAAERRRLKTERQQLALSKHPSQPTAEETARDG